MSINERPQPAPSAKSPATWATKIFRFIRWSTYAGALLTLILILHKSPPPPVESSSQAAARAEEKIRALNESLGSGSPATLSLDESELNSFLATHLDLSAAPPPAATPAEPTEAQVRSSVRDVKVQLVEDRIRAYVVFNLYGKDLTLELEGRLRSSAGYLQFDATSGRLGALPIPQSSLESAVHRMMDSPGNREKLKLPPELEDLRIEAGQLLFVYK
ncbi:MAG: hypothetical protein LAN71_03885 [Acidobacteriia bacterium]|nr:hypothetical protein [Terriglobia bacterium]